MELLLQRFSSGQDSTLGLIHHVSGSALAFRCFTLEDQFNEPKVAGETRIPAGRYRIKLRAEGGMHAGYAKRFGFHRGMLWLQDVPGFEWVYIHTGNLDDETEGCILVGDGAGQNVTEEGRLLGSVAAYTRLYQEIATALDGGQDVWLAIQDMA